MNDAKRETLPAEQTEYATSYDALPLVLGAEDVAAVLNISRSKAYALLHRADFPTLKIDKRLLVPKNKLLDWIDSQLPHT